MSKDHRSPEKLQRIVERAVFNHLLETTYRSKGSHQAREEAKRMVTALVRESVRPDTLLQQIQHLLEDVAEEPKRFERAQELAERWIQEAFDPGFNTDAATGKPHPLPWEVPTILDDAIRGLRGDPETIEKYRIRPLSIEYVTLLQEERMAVTRQPVGIIENDVNELIVVCDDGSVWKFDVDAAGWVEDVPIPGSRRAYQVTHDGDTRSTTE